MLSKHLFGAALMGAIVLPLALEGCSSDGSNPLCCTEFKVGATIDANIGGSAQSKVAVQSVADFAGVASAAVDDITTACRGIATDLDTPQADLDAAEQKTGSDRMSAYCDLAVKAITTIKAKVSGTITIKAEPPKCEASISAKANCQAKCDVSGKCDIKANPPTCTGGSLQVSCKGDCTAKAGATMQCQGGCTGKCQGSCTAKGGVAVDCEGKCEGTCAAGGSANGSGAQADGSCKGTCQGTCTASATAPAVSCSGSCNGSCDASCKAEAGASVTCDGTCSGDFQPLKCTGGKLEGGCKVDAKCDGNCDASVKAKAECTPPSVTVDIQGAADATAATKLIATLKANLGVIMSFKAKLDILADVGGTLVGNFGAVTDIKAACIPPVLAAAKDAGANIAASASATVKIAGSVGGK